MTLFYRIGGACARHYRLVIAVWGVLLLLALPLAPQLPGALRSGGFTTDDLEASRARQVLEDELGMAPSAMVIVIQSTTAARAGEAPFEIAAARVLAGVREARYVDELLTHHLSPRQVSGDGRTVYAIVTLDLPPDDSPLALEPVAAALTDVPGVRAFLAGGPAFYGDIQTVSENDLQRSELISLPLAAIALLLVFGSVVAAGVPIAVGGGAVLVALAIIFLATHVTPFSIFVLNLATLLGLGLGVDYALLMTSRFREELGAATDRASIEQAVAATVATAGRAVFFSGLTVLLGLVGLMLFEFMILRSVGLAGAIVVGLAVTAALTLLPATLSLLGPRIDSYAVPRPRLRRLAPGAWGRLAHRVMRRPLLVFVPTLGLLLLLGTPFLHARFNAPDATILPPDLPSRQAYELLAETFGEGEFAPLALAIRTTGPSTAPDNVGALYDYSRRLAADPRVTRVEGLVNVDPRLGREQYQLLYGAPGGPGDRYVADVLARTTAGNLTAFTVFTRYGPNRAEGLALVREIRDPGSALAPPAGMSVLVGGGAAEVGDVVARIAADFPRTGLFIVLTTFAVLFVLLRSLVLPIKAIVMNTLSIAASFGALVWIFQDGNLSALLGFVPLGFVETTLPVILFCVLFGLSMDYEVFLLSRMKEAHDQTADNTAAVALGMERSGRIVTSAALIVVVVAGSFAFADIVLIKAVGLGVAIAVALDASIVRALLVPSTMRLLGDWNWWLPERVRRFISTRLHLPSTAVLAVALALGAALAIGGCSPQGRLLGVDPAPQPSLATPSPTPARPPDPRPVSLPTDDAPHDRLTEWWYYTGHLVTADERRFGFEFVIFRAERGSFPVTWASHLALTDESGERFVYEQRSEIGPQVDVGALDRRPPLGFSLAIRGGDPLSQLIEGRRPSPSPGLPSTVTTGQPWTMTGAGPNHALAADAREFGLELRLAATRSGPVLHDGDGWVEFGSAGGSYYYSWPRMAAEGTLTYGASVLAVEGTAWFDHQWGDFIAVGGGGWDWFAVNLDDGTDLTISLVRDVDGFYPLIYGTLVEPDGDVRHLARDELSITPSGSWTSPQTGISYPASWRIELPDDELVIDLAPTVADQELDTRATTGVIYWEGSQVVSATRAGSPLSGTAYVELTGYTP